MTIQFGNLPPLQGKFTCKTDVWAFGVTLWEILTFAKEQPFAHLGDTVVIENLRHLCLGTGRQTYLPQPLNCPPRLYDTMLRCWSRDDIQRPTFVEILAYLGTLVPASGNTLGTIVPAPNSISSTNSSSSGPI